MKTPKTNLELTESITPHQKAFADALFITRGQIGVAYRTAFPDTNQETASVKGQKLLRHPNVKAYIERHRAESMVDAKIATKMVTEELSRLAFSNMGDFASYDDNGVRLVSSNSLGPEKLAAISEVSQLTTDKTHQVKFKLHDKLKALELLGKHVGMFQENINLHQEITNVEVLVIRRENSDDRQNSAI